MSIFAYFERRRQGELRMPKKEDECGIQWKGPVLSGEIGVELAQKLDEWRARAEKSRTEQAPLLYGPPRAGNRRRD